MGKYSLYLYHCYPICTWHGLNCLCSVYNACAHKDKLHEKGLLHTLGLSTYHPFPQPLFSFPTATQGCQTCCQTFPRPGMGKETHFCVLINGHLYQVAPSKALGFEILKIPLFYLPCLPLLMAKGTFSMLTYSTGAKGPEAGNAFYA